MAMMMIDDDNNHNDNGNNNNNNNKYMNKEGAAVAQWLKYCATNRKVAASIPDGVLGIFH
jgi:hypothetical protein